MPSKLPVLILQNLTSDGPAHLADWLAQQGLPFELFDTEAGQRYPDSVDGYQGLALLGGEMSANDDRPSLRQAERLILEAMSGGVPVIGHCLGGQLMARALGAPVRDSLQPEIGWQPVRVADTSVARAWFGRSDVQTVFHWHTESFDLPAGAELLATTAACPNQAFTVGERHLAMQFHVELDHAKLAGWSASTAADYVELQRRCPTVQSVQTGPEMRAQAASALAAQQRLADRIYACWLRLA